MSFRLRPRQVMALGAVILFVIAVSTVAHLASVARIALSAAAEEGELLARQLYHQSSQVVGASPLSSPTLLQRDPGIRAMLEGIVGYSHTVVYAAIVDPSDRVLAHSNPKLEGELLPPRDSLERLKAWWTLQTVVSLVWEPGVYEAQVPMRMGERPFGTVRVGVSTSLLRQELTRAALHSLALAVVALGLVVVVGLGAGHMLLQSLRKMAQRLEPTDRPWAPFVAELFDDGVERRNAAVKVPCPDGQSRELAVSSYRIPDGDRAGGGVLALRNLDPVRAVQSLVTYSQKLAALGRLTSGVAHEVKNPLNAMTIHIELLKARPDGPQPAVRGNLEVIAHEIQRLDRVVQGY